MCNIFTLNPKFCSRSCSAKYNNSKYPKRRLLRYREEKCVICGKSLFATKCKKFCSKKCSGKFKHEKTIKLFEVGIFLYPQTIRRIMLEKFGNKCNRCNEHLWNNLPIPLEVNHIDGNSNNNLLDNLELICPNCHAQTPNYKSKNKKSGRYYRKERYHKGLSY